MPSWRTPIWARESQVFRGWEIFLQHPYGEVEIFENPNATPRAFTPADCSIESGAFSKERHNLLVGCDNGGLRLYDLPSGALIRTFAGLAIKLRQISVSQDGGRVFTEATWWDLTTGSLGGVFPNSSYLDALVISPDGHLGVIVVSQADMAFMGGLRRANAYLWDLDKSARLAGLPVEGDFRDAQFVSGGKSVLLAREKEGAVVWDIRE